MQHYEHTFAVAVSTALSIFHIDFDMGTTHEAVVNFIATVKFAYHFLRTAI